MRESNLWKWLYKAAKPMRRTKLVRVENLVGSGYADVDGVHDGVAFKCELKIGEVRAGNLVKVEFQPLQIPFLRKWWECGGFSWVLIKVEHATTRYPKLFLLRGCDLGIFDTDDGIVRLADLDAASVIDGKADAETVIKVMAGNWG